MDDQSKSVALDTSHENSPVSLNRPSRLVPLIILHHLFYRFFPDNPAIRQPLSTQTQLTEGQQTIVEAVRLWYHETGPLAKARNEVMALSSTGHLYCIQLIALNFDLSATSMSIINSFS